MKSYTGDPMTAGFKKGQVAPDITLYTIDGEAKKVSELLLNKVPVLLVGGSYTCPMFRWNIPDVNEMVQFYKGRLQVYVVYQLEAHPTDVNSPYCNRIDLSMANITDDISYTQAKTFGQRKAMVDTLRKKMNVGAEILLDGPDNDYWNLFGHGPNNAYLIDTNMVVSGKNVTLDEKGENIWCDIDKLLHTNSGKCK